MNRVRLGLTGLALVFLIVMIAAATLRPFGDRGALKSKEETLATLGVTPGAETEAEEKAPPAETPPEIVPPADESLAIDEGDNLTEI